MSSSYPYLVRSPDGIVSYGSCYGERYLEIKCRYCDMEKSIDNIVQNSSWIEKVNDNYILKDNHKYLNLITGN